ncbi:MAG TPA: hypothetical protein VGL16_12990 [Actinomycetota bacterium]|jgi:hypothetical protein
MSLDRLIREGVDRLTSDVDPDVERHLYTSLRGARRRVRTRRITLAVGTVASIALVLIAGPRLLDVLNDRPAPANRPSPVVIGPEAIAGTYTVTVADGPAVVAEAGLAGEWTVKLRPDGTMGMIAPPTFTGSLEGISFEVDGDRLRTNAFVNDLCNEAQGVGLAVGVYRWELVGDDLLLEPQDDACEGRVAILGGLLRGTE